MISPRVTLSSVGENNTNITIGHARRRVAVVVPAYNEELVIGTVILRARQHTDLVIVVDDGSRDRTAEIADLAGAEVIRMPRNGGKASALMAGLKHARGLDVAAAVMMDGDGQHDPATIPTVLAPVLAGNADLVIGSRFLDKKAGIPAYRRFGQELLTFATNVGSACPTRDSQSGFRALSGRALENLDFVSEGYAIESDMIAHFASRGLVITEVPISVRYDVPNQHKMNPLSHGFGVLATIVGLIGYKRPLFSFGIPGLLLICIGIGSGIYTFSEFYETAQFHFIVFMVGISALLLGLLLMTAGLILRSLVQIMKSTQSRQEVS
ncbi:glycosyltransferase family 2 protein [Methanofollis formosanus]|uniref:Glycosyltransferase family 2 protein n=1 Tax=Methanofollis formosanus TaxID=299308 RepID=A0A8G1A3P2_9EURY|nr:glycosyltransferase family 2 protein [Methanofollis formosanus]QYZ79854.1 glycosyltransferase family 2 protein [Methanofollis formosanus]